MNPRKAAFGRRVRRLAGGALVLAAIASARESVPLRFLPPPSVPAGNPLREARVRLGKVLFWEEQLSSTGTVACGTCHQPAAGGSDPRSVPGSWRATHTGPDGRFPTLDDLIGSPGVPMHEAGYVYSTQFGMEEQVTTRRSPPVINAAYFEELFLDGRAGGALIDPRSGDTLIRSGAALESQALAPASSTVEMASGRQRWSDVTSRLTRAIPLALCTHVPAELEAWIGGRGYPALFREGFGTPEISAVRIAMAIASYERTLISDQAPIDSVRAGLATLRPEEAEGRALFDSLGCSTCHSGPWLTDSKYHYIGVRPAEEDSGRAAVTHRGGDLGAFRTPSLRNVALRPVYMHGGQIHTLEEVVNLYYRGGFHSGPSKSPQMAPRFLSRQQRAKIVAFLGRPLTDPRVAAEQPPFDRPSLFGESDLAPRVMHEREGVAGSSGTPPQPQAVEPPLLGNPSFTLAVYGARGGANATLVVRGEDPGLNLQEPSRSDFHRATIRLRGEGPDGGFGSADLALPRERALAGRSLIGRWYVDDPDAPGGTSVSLPIQFTLFAPGAKGNLPARIPAAAGPRLHPARPSSGGDALTIRYDLFRDEPARFSVEDSAGHTLRRLRADTSSRRGSFAVTWNHRDSSEVPLPFGRYFVRLETPTSSQRVPITGGLR